MGVVAVQGQRRRIVLWASVLGAAAALAPAARADDGTQPLPIAVPDAAALVETALEATDPDTALAEVDAIAEVAETVEPALESAPAEPDAAAEPAVPTAESAAPEPVETVQAPETAVPAPEAPVQATETPAEPVAAEPAPAAPAPTAQQVSPVNLNVSIRVESPGENGAVEQLNAAVVNAVTQATTAITATTTQYQPATPQYQAPATTAPASQPAATPAAPQSPTATTPAAAPAPTEQAEQWDWTWQWSCGEAISPEIVLPASSLLPIWNWNWEWNCGGSSSSGENSESQLPTQYQPSATQYQPANVNISIRILSPGNDGPVTQTNVAQTNVATTIVNTTTQLVTQIFQPVFQQPAPGGHGGSTPQPAPAAHVPELGGGLGGVFAEIVAAIASVPVEVAVEVVCCELVWGTSGFDGANEGRERAKPRPRASAAGDASFGPTDGAGRSGTTAVSSAALPAAAPVTPEAIAALAAPRPAVEAARHARAQERLKRRAAERAAPIRDRAAALGYAPATPLGAPDRSSKLHFLFLLPFAFALADAARRVVGEERPAAADPGRPEGRPG